MLQTMLFICMGYLSGSVLYALIIIPERRTPLCTVDSGAVYLRCCSICSKGSFPVFYGFHGGKELPLHSDAWQDYSLHWRHFGSWCFCICIFSRDHVQGDQKSGCSLGIFPYNYCCINSYAYQQRGTNMFGGEIAWMLSYSHVGQEADIMPRHLRWQKNSHAAGTGQCCSIPTRCTARDWQKRSTTSI